MSQVPPMRDSAQLSGLWALCRWANAFGANGVAIEIGAYAGEGSVVMAPFFERLICIDPWEDNYDPNDCAATQCPMELVHEALLERIRPHKNVYYMRQKSVDAANSFSLVDFVYVDGDHRYDSVLSDLKTWLPKIRNGGVLAGHDWNSPDIQRAYREVMTEEPTIFGGHSWAVHINKPIQ